MRRFLVLLAACAMSTAARAQLDLPGATAPSPEGTVSTPAAQKTAKPHVPHVAPVAPAETSLADKTLALNGGKSQMAFTAHDKSVEVSRLLLQGTKLSNAQEDCQVDIAGTPLVLTPAGKNDGLSRFTVALPACPFSFDVLNGAVLTSAGSPVCKFAEADCQAAVVGVWGPPAGDIGPEQVKVIERERTQAENSVRVAYKGLVSSTKDRAVIRGFASDQAGFSSHREESCRDYIGESRHGFCASRLTQARATTLEAQLVVAEAAKEARKKKHRGHSTED